MIFSNASVCFLKDLECVEAYERLIVDDELAVCKANCLSGCHELAFFPDIFKSPFTEHEKEYKIQNNYFATIPSEDLETDLAQVSFFYKYNYIRGTTKAPYTGATEFLCK